MRSSALKKTVALLQITAVVLLQLYAVAPLLSRNFAAHAGAERCNGDHAQCGCSSARIASCTCCCYQSKHLDISSSPSTESVRNEAPDTHADHHDQAVLSGKNAQQKPGNPDCCPKDRQTVLAGNIAGRPGSAGTEPRTKDSQGRTLPSVCAVPCGGDPAVITTSLENMKFLCASDLRIEPAALSAELHHLRSILFHNRDLAPPDPPPRLSLLC